MCAMKYKLNIGVVPYLNVLPLIDGLEDIVGVTLHEGSPVQLEVDLDRGVLDAALVPIVTLFDRPHLAMFPFAGIASEEEAGSVLFFKRPGAEIRKVAYDRGSRASFLLLRFLLLLDGIKPEWIPMDPNLNKMLESADGALLIGDAALTHAKDPRLVFDLVARWKRATNQPFVFAVWAARVDHPARSEMTHLFTEASMRGLSKLVAISNKHAGRAGLSAMDILVYYTKNLRFRLGIIHLDAIDLFRKKVAMLPPLPEPAPAATAPKGAPQQVRIR